MANEKKDVREKKCKGKLDKKEWEPVRATYKIMEAIGQGAYGMVVRAKHRITQTRVAIKMQRVPLTTDYSVKKIIREIALMRQLTEMPTNHHVVKLYDVVVSGELKAG